MGTVVVKIEGECGERDKVMQRAGGGAPKRERGEQMMEGRNCCSGTPHVFSLLITSQFLGTRAATCFNQLEAFRMLT